MHPPRRPPRAATGGEWDALADPPPDLATASPADRAAWLEAYEVGYLDGYQAALEHHEAQLHALWVTAAATARAVASAPDYATLAEQRGQPERAERQRATLRQRGIA